MFNIIFFLSFIFALIYFYAKHKYSYWRKRGVPYIRPIFPIGNGPLSLPKGISFGTISNKFYEQLKPKGYKLGGVYFGFDPKLVIIDPRYADDILKKDFAYFVDRGVYMNKSCPMTVNILSQNGNDWRTTRAKFTSIFTSAKMKLMFETLKLCSEPLTQFLEEHYKADKYVDILETLSCYNTDNISSVIFGIECNSFESNSNSPFRKIGKAIFDDLSLYIRIQMYFCNYYPDFARRIGITNVQNSVSDFFIAYIRDTIAYRKKNNIYRKDFMQLLLEMREGHNISLEDMAAQAFLFFSAGFETSGNTSAFLLLELGLHQDIQKKVRTEIKTILKKYNDDIPYEALKEMHTFTQAFNETLRKYPVLTTLTRVCVEDYTFRDSDISISKGMQVLIPVLSYHRDPDYYPDPEKWDIDRFNDPEMKHIGYLPFGVGPRNCIGFRFGIMQVKMAVISVLKNYWVTVDDKLKLPLKLDPNTFVTRNTQQILLKLHKEE